MCVVTLMVNMKVIDTFKNHITFNSKPEVILHYEWIHMTSISGNKITQFLYLPPLFSRETDTHHLLFPYGLYIQQSQLARKAYSSLIRTNFIMMITSQDYKTYQATLLHIVSPFENYYDGNKIIVEYIPLQLSILCEKGDPFTFLLKSDFYYWTNNKDSMSVITSDNLSPLKFWWNEYTDSNTK